MPRGPNHIRPGAQPAVLRNGTYSLCTCPTPGSAGCPAWCTRRVFSSCVPWSACEGWCAERCAPRCCQSAEWFWAKARGLGVAAAAPDDLEPPRTRRGGAEPPRTRRGGAEGSGRVRRVMVWQGERNEDGHLSFMYWPVMGTLLSGFQHHAARHPLRLVTGAGLTREYETQLGRLRRGDWFVWVGVNERFSQPWKALLAAISLTLTETHLKPEPEPKPKPQPWQALRQRGVRRIYYRTEPDHCTPASLRRGIPQGADEVWEFARHNLEGCVENETESTIRAAAIGAADNSAASRGAREAWAQPRGIALVGDTKLRVVPPGHVPPPWLVEEDLRAAATNRTPMCDSQCAAIANAAIGGTHLGAPPTSAAAASSLVFFGSLDGWAGRRKCFEALKRQLGDANLKHVYHVWNDAQYERLIRDHHFFVNLHKQCEVTHAPVTFRHSQLLSAARLVVSPPAHPLDEAAYAGLVTFVPFEQIAATHRAWAAMPAPRRAARQLEVWEAFRQRFDPPRLFEDAGIYEALLFTEGKKALLRHADAGRSPGRSFGSASPRFKKRKGFGGVA
jgi:hypothetical protein